MSNVSDARPVRYYPILVVDMAEPSEVLVAVERLDDGRLNVRFGPKYDAETAWKMVALMFPPNAAAPESTDRELLIETLGWLKAYGFENKPSQFNGLIGRIERQVGTGWEARGATPPEPPSMTAPRERCQD